MAMGGVRIEFPDSHTETRQAHKTMIGKTHKGHQCFADLMKSNTFTPLVFCYLFRRSFIDSSRLPNISPTFFAYPSVADITRFSRS